MLLYPVYAPHNITDKKLRLVVKNAFSCHRSWHTILDTRILRQAIYHSHPEMIMCTYCRCVSLTLIVIHLLLHLSCNVLEIPGSPERQPQSVDRVCCHSIEQAIAVQLRHVRQLGQGKLAGADFVLDSFDVSQVPAQLDKEYDLLFYSYTAAFVLFILF